MGYKSEKMSTACTHNANRMKRVYEAFDNKDLNSLTSMLVHGYLNPNQLIPDKGVSFFHLIIGHHSETFAFKVTKLFLRYGGDPNVGSEDSVTPVHVAAAWGRSRILHLLLVNGGDPWLNDDDKKNAFNYAFEEQEWDAVEMLHHFQQMYSSSSRKDIDPDPKYEMNFERLLMRKGEEMFEYAMLNDKDVKSTKTQTEDEILERSSNKCESPVLDIIKYFESHPSNGEVGCKKLDKLDVGWTKECFETSCKVIVNSDGSKLEDEKNGREEGRFVSSIHVDTTNLKTEELSSEDSVIALSKSSNESSQKSEGDVRSQLFLELQEAVLRRSKMRLNGTHEKEREVEAKTKTRTPSIIEVSKSEPPIISILNDSEGNSVIEDSLIRTETSSIQELNLENNSLLKHMSDFATKVMQEIKATEADNVGGRVSDSASSDQLLTGTFLTCEDESFAKDDDCKIIETRPSFGDEIQHDSIMEKSNDSFLSITEEYKYTDNEEGVVLLEKKLVVNPAVSLVPEPEADVMSDISSVVSDVSSVPSAISYASDTLRTELTNFGYKPGPINKTTKRLYLKKLWRLKKANRRLPSAKKAYSPELEKTLQNEKSFGKILSYATLEDEMIRTFEEHRTRKWREGVSKTSFNYLLLDPRISANLPKRAVSMSDLEIWNCFLSSVFYVGKGKKARPYAHLYEAVSSWRSTCQSSRMNDKIRYIIEIWSEGLGVICLHVFHNIIPVEAYSREAAMIDAFRLPNLKNVKGGEYYGSSATWTTKDKSKLGVYLLYKAMLMFLNEGERQIKPFDIV